MINGFVSIAKNLWQALLAFLRGDTTAAMGYLRQAFETYVGMAKSQFERLKTFLTNIWNGLTAFLKTAWQAAWTAIISYFSTRINDAVSKAKDLVSRVKSAFSINWSELGKRIIDGLITGLKNGIKAVGDAAKNVAKSALDAAKKVLGINSDSKAFIEIGGFSGSGFMRGFQNKLTPQAVSGTLSRVLAGASSTSNRSVSNTVNVYNPTAEPASKSVDGTLNKLNYLGRFK